MNGRQRKSMHRESTGETNFLNCHGSCTLISLPVWDLTVYTYGCWYTECSWILPSEAVGVLASLNKPLTNKRKNFYRSWLYSTCKTESTRTHLWWRVDWQDQTKLGERLSTCKRQLTWVVVWAGINPHKWATNIHIVKQTCHAGERRKHSDL